MIRFIVPGLPIAQPRQRHTIRYAKSGKPYVHNYTPAKHQVNAFKQCVRLAAKCAMVGKPLKGPVSLVVTFVFPRPRDMIWKVKPMVREWYTPKPDLDNVEKALKDAMTGIVWLDDSQVCRKESWKVYAAGNESAKVEVAIRELGTSD